MKIYRNTHYTGRNHDYTNIVACRADAPPAAHWVPATAYILTGLTQLYTQGGATFYGYL